MSAKELEIIKKLFKIAVNQQKTIMKLAQAQSGDPLKGWDNEEELVSMKATPERAESVKKNFPWLTQQKTNTQSQNATPAQNISTLDPTLKAGLDRVAPVLKGNLFIDLEPGTRNISAKYNKVLNIVNDPVKQHNYIQALLQKAFPGYSITLLGENNPQWIANY